MNSTTLLFNNNMLHLQLYVKHFPRSAIWNVDVYANETFYNIKNMVIDKLDGFISLDDVIITDPSGQIYDDLISVGEANLKEDAILEVLIRKKEIESADSTTTTEDDLRRSNDEEFKNEIELKLLEIAICNGLEEDSSSDIENNSTPNSHTSFIDKHDHIHATSNNNLSIDADETFVKIVHTYKNYNLRFDKVDVNKDTILHHLIRNYMTNAFFEVIKHSESKNHIITLLKMKNKHGLNPLHVATACKDPVKSFFFTKCILIELFQHTNTTLMTSKKKIKKLQQNIHIIINTKTKLDGLTPMAVSLYSCNFNTALLMIGGDKSASDLNESVGVDIQVRDECFQMIRNGIVSDPSLLIYIGNNAIDIMEAMISLCRQETKNIQCGKRLVKYNIKHLFGKPNVHTKDSFMGILHTSLNGNDQIQKLWRTKTLQKLIHLKWDLFARNYARNDIIFHLFLVICTTCGYVLNNNDTAALIFQLISVLMCFYLLLVVERKEFLSSGFGCKPISSYKQVKRRQPRSVIPVDSSDNESVENILNTDVIQPSNELPKAIVSKCCSCFPRYFLNRHNIIDFIGTTSIMIAGGLTLISLSPSSILSNTSVTDGKIIFSSIGVFHSWMMCLQLGLSSSKFIGIQISMVEKMIYDVFRITSTMFLFIVAFNCAFVILLKNDVPHFYNFSEGMFTLFLALLGDFTFVEDLKEPADSYYFYSKINETAHKTTINGIAPHIAPYKVLLVKLFVLSFGIIVNLILVNLLIAFLSNTYEDIESHSEAEFYKRRSERIYVVEGTLSRHTRRSLYTDVPNEIFCWETILENSIINNDSMASFLSNDYISMKRSNSHLQSSVSNLSTFFKFNDSRSNTPSATGSPIPPTRN